MLKLEYIINTQKTQYRLYNLDASKGSKTLKVTESLEEYLHLGNKDKHLRWDASELQDLKVTLH